MSTNEKVMNDRGISPVEESPADVAPRIPFDRPEPSAAQPQRRVRRKAAARASGEGLPIRDTRLRGPSAREQKQAAGLIRRQMSQTLVNANRTNSLKSTGPVTDVGKLNARLNAIKHGLRSAVSGIALSQLGEEPGDVHQIRRELKTCFHPLDRFELDLLEQMVQNRWRRRRLLRAESNLLAAQRLRFELEYGRKVAGEGRSPDATGEARVAAASGLVALPDSSSKFNLILQCLRAAQEAVGRERFGEEGLRRLEAVYGPDPGLAGAVLLTNYRQLQETGGEVGPDAPGRQAFMDSLTAEIACFERLLELHETTAVSLAAANAGAQSALSPADTERFTRSETFLDRQFDRLVKQFSEWRDAHREATGFVCGADADEEDLETLRPKIKAVAAARDKALTEAMKKAWGKDATEDFSGTEAEPRRGRPRRGA